MASDLVIRNGFIVDGIGKPVVNFGATSVVIGDCGASCALVPAEKALQF